jgi:type IV pilus assembly protein PilB
MIEPLGQILCERGVLDEAVLDESLEAARLSNQRIGQFLIENRGVTEDAVYRGLASQLGLPFLPAIEALIKEELLRELSPEFFSDGRCFPLQSTESVLNVVVADPTDLDVIAEVSALAGLPVQTSVTTPRQMESARAALYEGARSLKNVAGELSKEFEHEMRSDDGNLPLEEIRKKTQSKPVVKLVTAIFDEAIKLRASDVHIEAGEHKAVVRLRIDGMLQPYMELTRQMYMPAISRIKIQADLDIAEKRIPQDGRIRHSSMGREYDFRVSTLPTHHGEKVVIRILKHDPALLDMTKIGMGEHDLATLLDLIEKPQGMVFVTGPTGSGKSSTLFSCLNRIRHKAINITTIENPVEYKLEGINQVQINEKAGVTFAATLRSILRQDPDVILVGEIRDGETAEIAIQASQTGHLVFSTLHTNDAISAITRLRDLGIPGFLIGSSMLGILAQRLVRVLCPHCKKKAPASADTESRWKILLGGVPLPESYQPVGCDQCNNLGYRGRTGIFELITVNEALRALVSQDAPEAEIRKYCRSVGMMPLILNGVETVRAGITTAEELLRVVLVEDVAIAAQAGPASPAAQTTLPDPTNTEGEAIL